MEIGLEPKVNNINIKKIGKQYEINFGDEIWIYIGSRKELAELGDKIIDILVRKEFNEQGALEETKRILCPDEYGDGEDK